VVEVSTFDTIHSDLVYIKRVKGKPLMATRSRIGIELKDGSVLSAYHHWDGYPEWLGRILNNHYATKEQAADLIDGGDMSSCWNDTVWGKDRTDGQKYGPEYYSQRGENTPPRYDETREEFLSMGEEFSYIFTSAGWVCYDMNEFNDNDPEIVEIPSGNLAV
jgi:hypothetical protein